MKRNIFMLMLATLVSLLALTSCEKEPPQPKPEELIVGKWLVTAMKVNYNGTIMEFSPADRGVEQTYTFNADGTGFTTATLLEDESNTVDEHFKYEVLTNGDKLILKIIIEEQSLDIDILTLNNTTLVFYQEIVEDGLTGNSTTTFTRL